MNEASGTMSLCLPHVAIEPVLRRLGKGPASARARTQTSPPPRRALEQTLAACPVSVDVELAHLDVSLRELLDLRSGDVLPLGLLGERGASASLQGLPRFQGKPGRSRGRWAFQVLSKCSQTGEAEGSPHDLG
jgi:flagellar motor switch protein FliM